MGNVRITPMSVKGRIIQVVQTSPPQTWGTLWLSGISTGFVSGSRGFKTHDVIVSSFENNLFFSQINDSNERNNYFPLVLNINPPNASLLINAPPIALPATLEIALGHSLETPWSPT